MICASTLIISIYFNAAINPLPQLRSTNLWPRHFSLKLVVFTFGVA